MSATPPFIIRDATRDDIETIIDFNLRLASETEGKTLDRVVLARGVTQALNEPDRLRYWLAEPHDGGSVVGQSAVSREWSDWRNGWVWWFQSVTFVRNTGARVFRAPSTHPRAGLSSPT